MRAATFTTYINAQTDPGLEQAFARQAQIATSSYATITRAAEQATRATAGLLGARGTAGAGQGTLAIQQRATAIRSTITAAAEAERASTRLATATKREAAEARSAAREHAGLARGLTTTSVALNVVSGRLDPVASRLNTLTRAVTDLTGVQLGLAAFGATLFAIGRTANTYANLEARVRPFFETQKDVNSAMTDIIGIAERSRSALEPVVDVYTRLTTVGQNIGLTRQGIGRITEIATKAANVGGGSAQARDAALTQFGQALSGDFKAAGQEINSLKEQAPVLFQAILKGYKDVDGTIGVSLGRFRELAQASKLSTAEVLAAIERSSGFIDQMASRVPNTLSRAGTEFSNSLTIAVGRFDQAIGLTSTLADGLSLIAQNLRGIIALAAGIGTAFAAIKLGRLVQEGAGVVQSFFQQRAAADALALRRRTAAAESLAQHQREVAALQAEQAQIAKLIELEQARAAAARRDIGRANADFATGGTAAIGAPARESAAIQELNGSLKRSAELRQQSNVITAATAGANARAAASQDSLSRATEFTTKRVGVLRGAASSLIGFLGGPWGIAFAVATTAVYLLATAQSAAAKAADEMRDAQATLSSFIDRTTGRIVEQNSQLVRNRALQAQDRLETAKSAFGQAQDALRAGTRAQKLDGTGRLGFVGTGLPSGVQTAADAFLRSTTPGTLKAFQGQIDQLRKTAPDAARKLDDLLTSVVETSKPVSTTAAEIRVLTGRGRPGDVSRSFGERPTAAETASAATATTRAQINAAAATQAASSAVEKARAALQTLRSQQDSKTGLLPGRDAVQTQNELAAAMDAVTSATEAQKAARAGAAAGRAQERREARDATQDALDEAKARRDAALLANVKANPDQGSDAFLQGRIKILATYDDEVNKIDASRAASSSAAAQQVADAEKVAKAAAAAGEKRRDILSAYDDTPRARDRADDQIDDLQRNVGKAVDGIAFLGKTKEEIEEIKRINPLGTGIYTQDIADADAKRIEDGIRKPLRDIEKEYARNDEIARLQLQGRDAEATALQKKNQLLDQGVELSDNEYDGLVRNERQQLRINDALASRQRVVSTITGALDSARDTAEEVFTGLQTGGNVGNIFKQAFNDFRTQFARIQSRQLVEKLFAGSDEKLRALLEGRSSVDTAISRFGTSVNTFSSTTSRAKSALEKFTVALEASAGRVNTATGEEPDTGDNLAGAGLKLTNSIAGNDFNAIAAAGLAFARGANAAPAANDNGDIVVVGKRPAPPEPLPTSTTPTARQTYNAIGSSFFAPLAGTLDGLVDKISGKKPMQTDTWYNPEGGNGSTFFKKIGDSFGTALEGAGKGAIASGFAQALGLKQSQVGAQIGGALGALTGIPGLDIVGGLLGGTLGGLLQKPKTGSATLGVNAYGEFYTSSTTGNNDAQKAIANGLADSVSGALQSIADQLGGTASGPLSVSIGKRDDRFVVDTSGQGRTKYGTANDGIISFKTEEEAVAAALADALSDGVIQGISVASQNILRSGQDLQRALQKASVIESIPKRLLQLTDPVQYAVSTLNDEFSKMISYLKEGGATAEQFADAQKLYDLERADAIKQATSQAADAIDQFLKDMVGSSASPLNKKTTYENAAGELDKFKADIASGKLVDQNDLLSAARNFQDASRALNGSSSSFFDDFDMLRSLLEKARDNAGITDVATLPASPFSDASVQAAINGQTAATQSQTDILGGKLDAILGAIANGQTIDLGALGGIAGGGGGSLKLLPGFNNLAYY